MATVTAELAVKANPEVDGKYPTIRAHHLRYIGWAMGFGSLAGTPESVAADFTHLVLGWRTNEHPSVRDYAATTVGLHGETKEMYQSNLAKGLREFVGAKDDDLFTIVEEMPDTFICGKMAGCGIADHCTRRTAEFAGGITEILDETPDMDTFLKAVRLLKIPFVEESGVSKHVDFKPMRVRKVTLSAKVIKDVLIFMANPESGFADFFEGPQREE